MSYRDKLLAGGELGVAKMAAAEQRAKEEANKNRVMIVPQKEMSDSTRKTLEAIKTFNQSVIDTHKQPQEAPARSKPVRKPVPVAQPTAVTTSKGKLETHHATVAQKLAEMRREQTVRGRVSKHVGKLMSRMVQYQDRDRSKDSKVVGAIVALNDKALAREARVRERLANRTSAQRRSRRVIAGLAAGLAVAGVGAGLYLENSLDKSNVAAAATVDKDKEDSQPNKVEQKAGVDQQGKTPSTTVSAETRSVKIAGMPEVAKDNTHAATMEYTGKHRSLEASTSPWDQAHDMLVQHGYNHGNVNTDAVDKAIQAAMGNRDYTKLAVNTQIPQFTDAQLHAILAQYNNTILDKEGK